MPTLTDNSAVLYVFECSKQGINPIKLNYCHADDVVSGDARTGSLIVPVCAAPCMPGAVVHMYMHYLWLSMWNLDACICMMDVCMPAVAAGPHQVVS